MMQYSEQGSLPVQSAETKNDSQPTTTSRKSTLLAFTTGALIAAIIGAVTRGEVTWNIGGKQDAETSIRGRELSLGDRHPNMVWDCDDGGYSKRTLKLAYEAPLTSLFNTYERTYEASSVVVHNDIAYAIMDNSWSLYTFTTDLQRRSESNVRYGDPLRENGTESGYEALFYKGDIFYLVRESVFHEELSTYHAVIEEIYVHRHREVNDQFSIKRQCRTQFEFEGDSKGFEGVWAIHDHEKDFYLLALCEGNRCREKDNMSRGNGRIVVMKLNETDTTCQWDTVRQLQLPREVYFSDYSAMAIREDGFVAITSQEDSLLWVGRLLGKNPTTGMWNISEITFDETGEMFAFPKNENCETVYCNIEGIHWLDDGTLMAVSDKTHGEGQEDYRCFAKDQSVHVFALP